MDTKALRQKILDLAIRGKLVPQDPNDEPASALLERIRAEKQQMVKDGKLKAKDIKNDTIIYVGEDNLHYEKFNDGSVKCIEDEIPFELPEGWAWTRLRAVAEAIGDGDHQAPPQTTTGIPFLVISNVNNGELSFEGTRFVSREYYETLPETRKPRKGDLLFTVTGSYGIPVLVDTEKKFCFQRHIAIIRPCLVTNCYLYLVLGSSYVKLICDEKSTGTAQKTVGLATLREMLVPIAPYAESLKIVTQVQTALTIVKNISSDKDSLHSLIEVAKSKILDLAIRGKLVPQDSNDEPASVLLERIRAEKETLIKAGKLKRDKKESVIFRGEDNSYYETIDGKTVCIDEQLPYEVPYNWSWCRLKNIASPEENSFVDGPFGSNLKTDHYTTNREVRIIQLNNIGELEWKNSGVRYTTFQHAETLSRCKSYPGDIVIAKMMPAGRAIIIPPVEQVFIISSDCVRLRPSKIENTEYLMFMINSPIINKCVLDNVQGIGRTRTSLTKLKELLVPIPPLAEQASIVEQIHIAYKQLDFISKALA